MPQCIRRPISRGEKRMALSNSCQLSFERSANDKAYWIDATLSMRCGIVRVGRVKRTQGRRGFWRGAASFLGISICEGEIVFAPFVLGQMGKMFKWYRLDNNPLYNHGGVRPVASCPQCGSMWMPADAMVNGALEIAARSLEADGYKKEVRPIASSRSRK